LINYLLFAAIGLISGIGVFVTVINRLMGRLVDGWKKTFISGFLLIGILGGFVGAAIWLTSRQAGWVIILPLIFLLFCEGYRIWQTRRYKASPPVEVHGPTRSILRPITTTDLQTYRYTVEIEDPPFERLRIAFVSDFHINQTIPFSYYQMAIEQVNMTEPDVILVGGDYITEREYIPLISGLLTGLEARKGVYGILGNHDYWAAPDEVAAEVRGAGVTLLGDQIQRIGSGVGCEINLLGCEYPWGGIECIPDFKKEEFVLALSHTGDHIYRLASHGVRAVFSGHYHAGQFQIPGLGPIFTPSSYGRRFSHGHYFVNGSHLFVSAGIGAGGPPLRVYCPPDFFVVDFLKSS
jgi:predicted MPP superfamily phosphohydrolase